MSVDTWSIIKCALPALLAGGAYLLVQWLFHPPPGGGPELTRVSPVAPTGILWLGLTSRDALGACASPCKLRTMTVDCIARRLRAHSDSFGHDEPMPSRAQFSTWPHQARLIAEGDLEGLRDWQSAALDRPPDAPPLPPVVEPTRPIRLAFLLWQLPWLIALTAVWVLYCIPSPPCPPPPHATVTLRLSLAADQLFDFNDSTLSPLRGLYLKARLDRLLRQFASVRIESVDAFTDPLGTRAYNEDLSRRRRQTIAEFLQQQAAGRLTIADLPPTQDAPLGPPREALDVSLFESCMAIPGAWQRFRASSDLNLGFPPLYREIREAPGLRYDRTYSRIVNCLSPLRRVDVSISATIEQRVASITAKAAAPAGDQR